MSRVVAIMSVAAILEPCQRSHRRWHPVRGPWKSPSSLAAQRSSRRRTKGPEFGNYTYGGAVALNFNRYVGLEGEVGGTVGIAQDLTFRGSTANLKTPNTLTYNGNVVLNVATGHSVVPFVTGGVGGLTMFERTELSINDTQTLLTGNVGGGVKWDPHPTAVGDCVPTTVSSPCDPRTTLRTFLVRTRDTGIVSTERSSSTRCDNSRPLEREREFECALTLDAGSDEHES